MKLIGPASGLRRAADRGIMVGGVEGKVGTERCKPGAFPKLGPKGSA
jgi:hypothetical protein